MACRRARAPLSLGMKPGEEGGGGAEGYEWLTKSYSWMGIRLLGHNTI